MAKTSKKEAAVTSTKKATEIEKVTPLRVLSPFDDIDRMFDEFFSRGLMRPFRFSHPSWNHLPAPFEGRIPHVDIVDRDDEVFVKAVLPGVSLFCIVDWR